MDNLSLYPTPLINNMENGGEANEKAWNILNARFCFFGAGINKPEGQNPHSEGTLRDVYRWMNSMRMMELTRELRSIKDEKKQKAFKAEKLPFVTFSGTFFYRKADCLIKHSGLLCFDFDHLGGKDNVWKVRQMLESDPIFTTELMFTSPRGDGVKWVTHIDLTRGSHQQWYSAVRNYLLKTYGLEADHSPSNVASTCFLCWDASMVFNPLIAKF